MKVENINKTRLQALESKEDFLALLENDSMFFSEAFETMLTLIISDPKLTNQVAELIKSDYRDLFQAIQSEAVKSEKNDLPGCCQTSKD